MNMVIVFPKTRRRC